jgi:hypothetical protein
MITTLSLDLQTAYIAYGRRMYEIAFGVNRSKVMVTMVTHTSYTGYFMCYLRRKVLLCMFTAINMGRGVYLSEPQLTFFLVPCVTYCLLRFDNLASG